MPVSTSIVRPALRTRNEPRLIGSVPSAVTSSFSAAWYISGGTPEKRNDGWAGIMPSVTLTISTLPTITRSVLIAAPRIGQRLEQIDTDKRRTQGRPEPEGDVHPVARLRVLDARLHDGNILPPRLDSSRRSRS